VLDQLEQTLTDTQLLENAAPPQISAAHTGTASNPPTHAVLTALATPAGTAAAQTALQKVRIAATMELTARRATCA
jgi:hypothetical protein